MTVLTLTKTFPRVIFLICASIPSRFQDMYPKGFLAVSILFIVSRQISTGLAIRCYQCQEIMGPNSQCQRNVKQVLTANCTESFSCIKYLWKEGNITTIYRNCAPHSECDRLRASQTPKENLLLFCGTCNSTLCNSAPVSNSSFISSFWILMYSVLKIVF